MNTGALEEKGEIYRGRTNAGVRQDKQPPGRLKVASAEPQTARSEPVSAIPPADNRPKHHGSENRQTALIWGRVAPHIKSEVVSMAKLKGWTESKTVASLVEQALARNLAEQFAVMLKTTIQDAIETVLNKRLKRVENIALQGYYSGEQGRILQIQQLRFILGEGIDELPLIITESQKQAWANMRRQVGEENRGEENAKWQ